MASKQILNPRRHKHELYREEGVPDFKCSGCRQLGQNVGYQCRLCPKFILHDVCATLPDIYNHPDNPKHPYDFHTRTLLRHDCCRCRQVLRGFMFESRDEHLRLHPLCMVLPVYFDVTQLQGPSRGTRLLQEISYIGNSVADKLLDGLVTVLAIALLLESDPESEDE